MLTINYNSSTNSEIELKTENLAGGQAYTQTPELELVSILLTSFANDTFYKSANDTFLPYLFSWLKACWTYFNFFNTLSSLSGSFIYQSFIGDSAILAPFVPPL